MFTQGWINDPTGAVTFVYPTVALLASLVPDASWSAVVSRDTEVSAIVVRDGVISACGE